MSRQKAGEARSYRKEKSAEVRLITRPRRFGKTMAMSMLASFFDIRKSSRNVLRAGDYGTTRTLRSLDEPVADRLFFVERY
ncbi:MAG: AAA family ATPase [Lachnospiraceae bacterium]